MLQLNERWDVTADTMLQLQPPHYPAIFFQYFCSGFLIVPGGL
jgi:hypothetical protein